MRGSKKDKNHFRLKAELIDITKSDTSGKETAGQSRIHKGRWFSPGLRKLEVGMATHSVFSHRLLSGQETGRL